MKYETVKVFNILVPLLSRRFSQILKSINHGVNGVQSSFTEFIVHELLAL
jgi:hypothetical protein